MKRGLFLKYVVLFVGLVTGVLVINAALDIYFVYQDNRRASIEVQREKAIAAAEKIESFVREIERQIGWVSQAQWASLPDDQRRFDYVRLLRQVLPITELVQLDAKGREQLRVSRLDMDVVGAGTDRSQEPAFKEAVAHKVYFSPVYFRKESEPYLTMAVASGNRRVTGVTVADINLKLILDVISQIRIGNEGYAYVVDRQGRLVADPDISLVLRRTDMSHLAQVAAALKGEDTGPVDATNRRGLPVLSAHAAIPALNWLVFVELPIAEAQQPVVNAGLRALALLLLGLFIAGGAAALLARRMVVPIRALQAGAQRIGSGELGHRLSIKTGDELEALANQFNHSAEALEESYATLEQQTATADILGVISQSPTDVQPVFDAIARSAMKLLNGWSTIVWRYEGERLSAAASCGGLPGSNEELSSFLDHVRPQDLPFLGDAIRTRSIQQIIDVEDAGVSPVLRDIARLRGWRANIGVPMLSEGLPIGLITLARAEPGVFAEREVKLLKTFADQAVIAIQNVRLFTELRESLEQQTASAEILQVINASPGDVAPVFDAMLEKAMALCGADFGFLTIYDGTKFSPGAMRGVPSALAEYFAAGMDQPQPGEAHWRILAGEDVIHNLDQKDEDAYRSGLPLRRAVVDLGGARSALVVALRKEGVTRGALTVYRKEVRPFSQKEIALMQNFAAQAVIAMESARLFTELRESLEQQTATADILRVISQSPTDVQPVLDAVAKAALRFCGATDAIITLRHGEEYVHAAHEGAVGATLGVPRKLDRSNSIGRAITDGCTVHLPDMEALDPVEWSAAVQLSASLGFKAAVATPMLREDVAIGGVLLRKNEPSPFTPRQIELLEAFAAQAVIAIENVRLFTEIQEKSRQLEIASQHKSQFLANMSHELRTPLNAIIGYTEMMADGLYGTVPEKAAGVLERVQSNGRHLLGLINDVLDLSKIEAGQLVLAIEDYSVPDMVNTVMAATESLARSKGLALEANVTPGLPTGRGDARRLSQVLLNLVGNAIKFTDQGKVEIQGRRAGEFFELSVVDTGFGIAAEDQKRIFDEFQQVDNTSTRKKGGTGLGLSISRKIVELHGGSITVESEIGEGSTFRVTVPINAVPVREAAQ